MLPKYRVLIVNDNEISLSTIKKLIESQNEIKVVGEGRNGKQAIDLAKEYQPDIIVMDINMPIMNGFDACLEINQSYPYIGIILVGPAESQDVLRKAMQSGAGDFLELPLTSTKLCNSIASLSKIKSQQKKLLMKNPLIIPNRHPKVISIFSSKGGVGKTVLATNIAVALKKETREDVLVLDLDLQFGDVVDLLNVRPKVSIIDLLSDIEQIDVNELNRYLSHHSSGVKILSSPSKPEEADFVSEEDVKEVISLFLNKFDYIVADLPPFFNSISIGCMEMSDEVLLVGTTEVPTLRNIKGALEILRKLDFPQDKLRVVLNRYDNNREIKVKDAIKFLGVEGVFCISDDPEIVSTSINMGEPVVLRYSKSIVGRQMTNLSKNMIDYKSVKNNEKTSFIKRLLGKRG